LLRVGVVGVGEMGQHHARVYSELDCKLVGVADSDIEKAKKVGKKHGIKFYANYKDLINKEKVDAVSIAVPTFLHKKVAMDFLKKEVNCLIEKPITSNIDDAKEIIEEAERNHIKLMIGHIERFNPAVLKLKEIIDNGTLGKIVIISTRRVGPFPPRIKDAGIIIDFATHDIDIARYLIGREPVEIYSKFGKFEHENEDYAIVVLDFGTTKASIEVNWFTPYKVRSLVATGSKGIVNLDYITQDIVIHNSKRSIKTKIEKEEPLKLELKHFLDCIENNKEPLICGYEGLKVLDIALKAKKE
jgi:UDP-N-acetylglucosamine 3-dehydrogenase